MKKIELKIDGMHCEHCAKRIEETLKENKDIKKVKVDFKKKTATIEYNENVSIEEIEETINECGYKSLGSI